MNSTIVNILPIFIIIIFILTFIFVFTMFISPKFRGKMMSRNMQAAKHMVDNSKDDIQNIQENLLDVQLKAINNAVEKNKDNIKNTSTNMANASKEGIEITTRAIKKGLTEDEKIFCKHCGSAIDSESKFCNKCGKEQ